jgi:ABC-type branched-subunit amino acid transport system permease subunit
MVTAKTVEVLAIAYIGGRGSLWGGMVVAFPFVILIELLQVELDRTPRAASRDLRRHDDPGDDLLSRRTGGSLLLDGG